MASTTERAIPLPLSGRNASNNPTPLVYYALANDIDAQVTASWSAVNVGSLSVSGFVPIGSLTPFSGQMDGRGHVVSNLKIAVVNSTSNSTMGVGLFGTVQTASISLPPATIQNVGMFGGSISATSTMGPSFGSFTGVGALIGAVSGTNSITVTNDFADTVNVSSDGGPVGGLVGLIGVSQHSQRTLTRQIRRYLLNTSPVALSASSVRHCNSRGLTTQSL